MYEIGDKFLPIGTVVLLKGGEKRLMITGFCVSPIEDSNKLYDYTGCIFPEGILVSNQNALFNHEQIEKVYHMGLTDDEEKLFKVYLNNYIEENGMDVSSVMDNVDTSETGASEVSTSEDIQMFNFDV